MHLIVDLQCFVNVSLRKYIAQSIIHSSEILLERLFMPYLNLP